MVRWPGVVCAGVVSDQACITFDFTASIARIAGVTPSADKPLEGIDIVEHVAEEKKDFERTLYCRKPRGDTVWKGIRHGSRKYIGDKRGDTYREYLFDLTSDLGEENDLKDARPGDFAQLYDAREKEVRRDRRGQPQ